MIPSNMLRLDMNHVIKVADFGLSVSMADEKNYFRSEKESEKLPVKWMAPESLLDRKFSELSDVVSMQLLKHCEPSNVF